MDPVYSVIIPAFDEERYLPATLTSLGRAMAAQEAPGEVVVCDNNSSDRTAELARAAGARVVFEGRNQIARARNAGARAARGRWLVFLDADTELSPGLLAAALEALGSGRVCGGGVPLAMDGIAPGRVAERILGAWNWLSRRLRLAAGAFLYASREAFEEVGGFPESVYASEEIWLSRRLGRWGRARGLEFRILEEPVRTSGRKLRWYPGWQLFGMTVILVALPWLVRSRSFCWLWYRRPAPGPPAGPAGGEPGEA